MQKMILVPVEQYNHILRSYYETMNELERLKKTEDLVKRCKEKSYYIGRILSLLERLSHKQLKCIYLVIVGMVGTS